MSPIASFMQNAVQEGVFPGAVVWASKEGKPIFTGAYGVTDFFSQTPVTMDTIYDLASLTKPLVTTLLLLKLVQEENLFLSDPIERWLPFFSNTSKANITIEQLLRHQSGLPAWAPLWTNLQGVSEKDKLLFSHIQMLPQEAPPGGKTIYSDIGFILLQKIIEKVGQKPLDQLVDEWLFTPLQIDLFFRPMDRKIPHHKIAPTEFCTLRKGLIHGIVHDDNAWSMGGVAGHAGLFGTAEEVHTLLTRLLEAFHFSENKYGFDSSWLRYFFTQPDEQTRPLGFDYPSGEMPSCGRYFSSQTVGHLGFTGTSFWMDLKEKIIIILLSNRVHLTRYNAKIKSVRPILHDMLHAFIQNSSQ